MSAWWQSISVSPGCARLPAAPMAEMMSFSTRMSAAGRKSSVPFTVRTAPPLKTIAMSIPAARLRSAPAVAPGRCGQKIAEGAQALADVVDHQPGRRREAAIARHQDADAALRQARLGQRHVYQLAAADLLQEADGREEADAEARLDHLPHELDGVGDDARPEPFAGVG